MATKRQALDSVSRERILDCISSEYGIDSYLVFTRKREMAISEARQMYAYMLTHYSSMTTHDVSKHIQRSESNVTYWTRRMGWLIQHDQTTRNHLNNIISKLGMGILSTKPTLSFKYGEFTFKFYINKSDMSKARLNIGTTSDVWTMSISGKTDAFGYLYAAALQGMHEQCAGYAMYSYITSTSLTNDPTFMTDVANAVNEKLNRLEALSKELASAVTEQEELAAQAFMSDMAEYSDADEETRKEIIKQWHEDAKGEVKTAVENIIVEEAPEPESEPESKSESDADNTDNADNKAENNQ